MIKYNDSFEFTSIPKQPIVSVKVINKGGMNWQLSLLINEKFLVTSVSNLCSILYSVFVFLSVISFSVSKTFGLFEKFNAWLWIYVNRMPIPEKIIAIKLIKITREIVN